MDKKTKIIYWVITSLFLLPAAISSIMYFVKPPELVEGVRALGIPYELLYLLGPLKLLGVIAIITKKAYTLTEWAYAGFVFDFIGATWIHYLAGHGGGDLITPLVLAGLVIVSHIMWRKAEANKAIA